MSKNDVSLRDIFEAIQQFREEVRETYVTKDEFLPVKMIAFGLVSTVILTVLGAIVAGVVNAF